jgi:hypothetical protein
MIRTLTDAALDATDEGNKFELNTVAWELETIIAKFAANPTADALAEINGRWIRGVRLLSFVKRSIPRVASTLA